MINFKLDDPRFSSHEFELRADTGPFYGYWTELGTFVLQASGDHIQLPFEDAEPLGAWLANATVNDAIKLSDEEIDARTQRDMQRLQSVSLAAIAGTEAILSEMQDFARELAEKGDDESANLASFIKPLTQQLAGSNDHFLGKVLDSLMPVREPDAGENKQDLDYTRAVKALKGVNGGLFLKLDVIREQSGRDLELDEVQLLGNTITGAFVTAQARKSVFGN